MFQSIPLAVFSLQNCHRPDLITQAEFWHFKHHSGPVTKRPLKIAQVKIQFLDESGFCVPGIVIVKVNLNGDLPEQLLSWSSISLSMALASRSISHLAILACYRKNVLNIRIETKHCFWDHKSSLSIYKVLPEKSIYQHCKIHSRSETWTVQLTFLFI